ncbi:MAG: creatininase family protein [Arenibacterium sp.]
MRRLDWSDFRADEFGTVDAMTQIAILPLAAIEQHGPHLPVGTDTIIAEGMLAQLRQDCPEDLNIRILPVQAVGKSNEHLFARGTVTLSAETALAVWLDIGLSVARAGYRKIVLVNSHGGNTDLMSILARELRVRAGMLAVKCSWGSFGYPDGLFSEFELRDGLHGGDVETSLVLAFAPAGVDMAKATRFGMRQTVIPPVGPVSYGWVASDLNDDGVLGDAHLATAEKGRATAEHAVAGFISTLRDMVHMELPSGPVTAPE